MRRRRVAFLVLVVAVSLLAQPGLAAAVAINPPWVTGGVATYDGGGLYLAQGVYARSRMYPKQASQDGDWVNSVLAKKDTGDFVEAGWYWEPDKSIRTWFSANKVGTWYHEEPLLNIPNFATNSWVGIHVRRDNIYNDRYNIYVDGEPVLWWVYTGMTSCRANVSCERYDTADTNQGAWLYAQVLRLNGNKLEWVYFPNATRASFLYEDPYYDFYANYVDRSDHYVYCDDHQN